MPGPLRFASIAGRFRNNFLALANALISFATSFIYIRAFGISSTSDSIYFATSIIAAFSLIPNFLIDQFLQYYNEYKYSNDDDARAFLLFNLLGTAALGALLAAAFGVAAGPIVAFMYPKLAAVQLAEIGSFLETLKYLLGIVGLNAVLQAMAVSFGKIKAVYLGRIGESCAILAGLVLMTTGIAKPGDYPLFLLAGAAANGLFLAAANRRRILEAIRGPRTRMDGAFIRRLRRYFYDSFTMRVGHNLQGFFLPLVTTVFWSAFPGNPATCYSYASKFYSAIMSVLVGPSQLETQHFISDSVARGRAEGIPPAIRRYHRTYVPLVLAAAAATAGAIPTLIHLINADIGPESIRIILACFALLALWLAVQCAEGPYVITIVAKKKGLTFIVGNAVNLGIVAAIALSFRTRLYALPISFIIAQSASLAIYRAIAMKAIAASADRGALT